MSAKDIAGRSDLILSMSATLDRATAHLAEVASAGAGFLLMSVGGWFGGRLVYQYGIAVKSCAAD